MKVFCYTVIETDAGTELNDGMDNFGKRRSRIYHKNFCLSNSVDDFNIWEKELKQEGFRGIKGLNLDMLSFIKLHFPDINWEIGKIKLTE